MEFMPRIAYVSPTTTLLTERNGVSGLTGALVTGLTDGSSVTSQEVDGRIASLTHNVLYRFHYGIVDERTGQRYSTWELLEGVRAIRDVSAISCA